MDLGADERTLCIVQIRSFGQLGEEGACFAAAAAFAHLTGMPVLWHRADALSHRVPARNGVESLGRLARNLDPGGVMPINRHDTGQSNAGHERGEYSRFLLDSL